MVKKTTSSPKIPAIFPVGIIVFLSIVLTISYIFYPKYYVCGENVVCTSVNGRMENYHILLKKVNKPVSGIVKKYYKSGLLNLEMDVKNGYLNGRQKEYYTNGLLSRDFGYENGTYQGPYKKYYREGSLKEEGNFLNGKKNGLHKEYYDNGYLGIETEFEEGKKNGSYKIMHYKNGKLLRETNFVNDGLGTFSKEYDVNGRLRFEIILNNNEPSPFKIYTENGELKEEGMISVTGRLPSVFSIPKRAAYSDQPYAFMFFNDKDYLKGNKLDGPFKVYYPTGLIKEERNYVKGIKEGSSKIYYDNGKIQEEQNYKKGIKNGPFKTYYKNGQISTEGTYVNGKLNGTFQSYYESRKPKEKTEYRNGILHGKQEFYSETGQKTSKSYFQGLKDGKYEERIDCAHLEVGTRKNGKKNGPYTLYFITDCQEDEEKQVIETGTYVNGLKEGPYKDYCSPGSPNYARGTYHLGKHIGKFYDCFGNVMCYSEDGAGEEHMSLCSDYEMEIYL